MAASLRVTCLSLIRPVLASPRHSIRPPPSRRSLDLLLLVRGRERFTEADDWIERIGEYWVAVRHPGPFEDLPVRQVLFDGALDFDIVPIEAGTLAERIRDPGVAFALGGGWRGGFTILIDKDGELSDIDHGAPGSPPRREALTRSQYEFLVSDFLFQVVWAAKHLRRGELWAAKDDVDCYMKGDLVRLLEAEAERLPSHCAKRQRGFADAG